MEHAGSVKAVSPLAVKVLACWPSSVHYTVGHTS